MTAILLAAILVFALPAWIPYLRRKYSAPLLMWAFGLIVVNEVLQLFFVAAVGTNLIPLYYSSTFALVGLPLCVVGGAFGLIGFVRYQVGAGCFLTSAFGVVCWLFLVSMH